MPPPAAADFTVDQLTDFVAALAPPDTASVVKTAPTIPAAMAILSLL
jgi:hypothetical protein